jgi:major capsid protein E
MSIGLYDTQELIMVQQLLPDLPDGFWRNLFNRVITSDREDIMFELADIDQRVLAPFVAPNVQGRIMRQQGYYARQFRPAYVKPKHIILPQNAIARRMGEPILGGMSLQARFDAAVADAMRLERESIERRWDWMAAQAVIYGMVTVVGDDYPSRVVDFLRDARLTAALSGTARWDQTTTADPLTDLVTMTDLAFDIGYAPITSLVFGTQAWANFIKNQKVIDLLSTLRRGGNSEFAWNTLTQKQNYQFMGFIDGVGGRFEMWRYTNWYSATDSNGVRTKTDFLDPRDVVGYGNAINGIQMFGAIMDADAQFLTEATIFPKMWREPDPSAVFTMSQSAPLMVPTNPNNTFRLRVLA